MLVRLALCVGTGAALSIGRKEVVLASGQKLEWLSASPSPRLPLCPRPRVAVCVHGTFHGAWCWAEAWLPRLAREHGIEAHAISLRGTSGSPCDAKTVTLSTHAADLAEAVAREAPGRDVFLVAHSFGVPVATDAVAAGLAVRGVAALCGVPPAGNGPGTARVLRRSLREAWRITRAFALKTAATSPDDANAVFFNGALDAATAATYAARFRADSAVGLDLADFTRSLPRWPTTADGAWAARPPGLAALVVGAAEDRVVDAEAVAETAAFYETPPVVLAGAPHDLMLAPGVADPACDLVARWIAAA